LLPGIGVPLIAGLVYGWRGLAVLAVLYTIWKKNQETMQRPHQS
jgi:hypothetical protein